MDTEIRNVDMDSCISANIQHHVNQSAINFSKQMIIEGLEQDNISKVQFYVEMWSRYTDRELSRKYG